MRKPLAIATSVAAASLALAACSGQSEVSESETADTAEFAETEAVETVTQAPPEPTFGIDARPVRIGFDGPEADACGGYGEITALNPESDNFLSVRAAPDSDAEELDQLSAGSGVWMCETADGWIGIVYERSGAAGNDCGINSPVDTQRNYGGPCRSGWISQRYVELLAG